MLLLRQTQGQAGPGGELHRLWKSSDVQGSLFVQHCHMFCGFHITVAMLLPQCCCCCCCRGKRRLTNDFAAIVHRIKLLGFNAIRVQFKFSDLNLDIPTGLDPEFFPCLVRPRGVAADSAVLCGCCVAVCQQQQWWTCFCHAHHACCSTLCILCFREDSYRTVTV